MNNHPEAYQKKPMKSMKRLVKLGETPVSSNFDKENVDASLWKSLWNL